MYKINMLVYIHMLMYTHIHMCTYICNCICRKKYLNLNKKTSEVIKKLSCFSESIP